MQQALEYAETLDVPFAYSSNGDAFLEHDRTATGGTVTREIPLDQFQTPEALWARYCQAKGYTTDQKTVATQDYYEDDQEQRQKQGRLSRAACPKFDRQTFHEFSRLSVSNCQWARNYAVYTGKGKKYHTIIRAWLTNGFASSSSAGKSAPRKTRTNTSKPSRNEAPFSPPYTCKQIHETYGREGSGDYPEVRLAFLGGVLWRVLF